MLKDLINIMSDANIPNGVILLVALLIILLFSPVVKQIIRNKAYYHKKKRQSTRKLILQHPFFQFMKYCMDYRINRLEFGSEFKNNALQDMLMVKFRVFYLKLRIFAKLDYLDRIDKYEFKKMCLDIIDKSKEVCLYEWKNLNIPKIEYIIIEFEKWHEMTILNARLNIEKIIESTIYDNNYERLDSILTIYSSMFEITVLDVENGLKQVNGNLNGLEYKKN